MKYLFPILLLCLPCHADDVHLGRLSDLTWTGTGADRVASFSAQGGGVQDVTNGLVGWWKLDGNGIDSTAYSNSGTVYNATSMIGLIDGAYSLEPVNSYISASATNLTFPDNEASLTFWLRCPTEATGNGFMFFDACGYSSHYQFSPDTAYIGTFRNVRVDGITLSPSVTKVDWHLVSITTTPGTGGWRMYQNDQLISVVDGLASVYVSTNFYIGRSFGHYYLSSHIDDVRLYNRALSSNEIVRIWNLHKP